MILAILQARSSSSRFPGKVLSDLHGRPMILQQLARIKRSRRIDDVVVATSTDSSDDQLAEVVAADGIAVRRGPLDDVVTRFALVVDEFSPDHIVRLTADCPLADAAVIDSVIEEHLRCAADYTSNVNPPTFPDGLDVEVLSAEAFARLRESPLSAREREHVTLRVYSDPGGYDVQNVAQSPGHERLRWTVDVPADLEFVEAVYRRLYPQNAYFGQSEILELLAAEPNLSRTQAHVARNAALQEESKG